MNHKNLRKIFKKFTIFSFFTDFRTYWFYERHQNTASIAIKIAPTEIIFKLLSKTVGCRWKSKQNPNKQARKK